MTIQWVTSKFPTTKGDGPPYPEIETPATAATVAGGFDRDRSWKIGQWKDYTKPFIPAISSYAIDANLNVVSIEWRLS